MQNRTENWLKKSAQSEENASLRSDDDEAQGGNRAKDETPEGTVGVGTPVGDGVYLMLLLAGAYACFYLQGQKDKKGLQLILYKKQYNNENI
jgi:hypothetical protein